MSVNIDERPHTQTKYYNPCCACELRVKNDAAKMHQKAAEYEKGILGENRLRPVKIENKGHNLNVAPLFVLPMYVLYPQPDTWSGQAHR